MAKIPNHAFISIENGLHITIQEAWVAYSKPILVKVIKAVADGDYAEACSLVNGLTYDTVLKKTQKYLDFSTTSAFYFGASRLTDMSELTKRNTPIPHKANAITQYGKMLSTIALPAIQSKTLQLIALEEVEQTTKKAEFTQPFVSGINASVTGISNDYALWLSSLHTSRLSAWGFTTEAELLGMEMYVVNEQLDGRTCPVCNIMHGKIFKVAGAKAKLEAWLGTEDVADLKSIAPWPAQSKAAIDELKGMSIEQLASRGWDTPPYHPLCRGLLDHVNNLDYIPPEPAPANDLTDYINSLLSDALTPSDTAVIREILPSDRLKALTVLAETPEEFDMLIAGSDGVVTSDALSALTGVDTASLGGTQYVEAMVDVTTLAQSGVQGSTLVIGTNGSVLSGSEVVTSALNDSQHMVKAYIPSSEFYRLNKF